MITRDEAESRVADHIAETENSQDIIIARDETIERPWGWVVLYNTRDAIETGDPLRGLVGNAPVLIERASGRILVTGTARPTEFYIANYEATGDPHLRLGREVEIEKAKRDANLGRAARVLYRESDLSLGEAKRGLDRVCCGSSLHAVTPSASAAQALCEELRSLGVRARQVPEPAA